MLRSSVSKMIADLEKEWNVLLLERDRSGVCLTSEGQRILPLAREILNDHRRHTDTIGRMKGMETGLVRIGTFASAAIHWLPNIFAHFRKNFPGIEYEMLLGDYDEIEKQIADGRVDCGFLRLPTEPSWDTLLLKEDEYKVVLPQNHPLAAAESIPIEKLEGQPFLLLEHVVKPRCRSFWKNTASVPRFALPRGRTLLLWQWRKRDWGSESCRR